MNTYEAWVTGVTGRRVTVEAKNQKAAEIEAMREFTELVGAESDVEVIDITRIDNDEMTPAEIRDFYDRNGNMTLLNLSGETGLTVPELKKILMEDES